MRCYFAINPPYVDDDGDPFTGVTPPGAEDKDQDTVPDNWEIQVGLNPFEGKVLLPGGQPSSLDWFLDPNDYASWERDREAFARMYERGVQGDIDQDWAEGGLNHGSVPPLTIHNLGYVTRINRAPQSPADGVTATDGKINNVQWPSLP